MAAAPLARRAAAPTALVRPDGPVRRRLTRPEAGLLAGRPFPLAFSSEGVGTAAATAAVVAGLAAGSGVAAEAAAEAAADEPSSIGTGAGVDEASALFCWRYRACNWRLSLLPELAWSGGETSMGKSAARHFFERGASRWEKRTSTTIMRRGSPLAS